jgi:hypothetical protein
MPGRETVGQVPRNPVETEQDKAHTGTSRRITGNGMYRQKAMSQQSNTE